MSCKERSCGIFHNSVVEAVSLTRTEYVKIHDSWKRLIINTDNLSGHSGSSTGQKDAMVLHAFCSVPKFMHKSF